MEPEGNATLIPKVGDIAGVKVPFYRESVIKALHDDGTATVRVKGITLQVLRDDDDTGLQETTWRYDPAAMARLRSEREQADEPPDDEFSLPAVTWKEWARETIDAICSGPDDRRATAIATLHKLAGYLDDQYDSGYHGIAPMPLEGCNMGWDW